MSNSHPSATRRRFGGFALLLVCVGALRVATLTGAQTHVNADEAIIGLMAKHIAEGRLLPVYFYGQAYNGGAALEAYLAAPGFALFGSSVIALKGVIVALSLAAIAMMYAFVRRFWNARTALWAAALFACSPTLTMWHYTVRGGYGEYLLFLIAMLYCAFTIAERVRARALHYAALGGIGGLGLWCFEITLTTFAPLLVWLAWRKPSPLRDRRSALLLAGFVTGYAPSLLYNLRNAGANWRTLGEGKLSGGANAGALLDPETLWQVLSWELPRFFGPDTVVWYLEDWHVSGALFYAAALVTVALVLRTVWRNRRQLGGLGRTADFGAAREPVLLGLAVCCAVPYAIVINRLSPYLLGVIPLLSVLGASHLTPAVTSRGVARRTVAGIAALGLCGAGVYEGIQFARQDRVELLRIGPVGRLEHTLYDGEDTTAVIEYLRKRNIEYVWATASLAYPIAFESAESVIASSKIFPWSYAVVPGYDRWVQRSARSHPVFVLPSDSAYLRSMDETFTRSMRGPYTRTPVRGLVVLEPAGVGRRPDRRAAD